MKRPRQLAADLDPALAKVQAGEGLTETEFCALVAHLTDLPTWYINDHGGLAVDFTKEHLLFIPYGDLVSEGSRWHRAMGTSVARKTCLLLADEAKRRTALRRAGGLRDDQEHSDFSEEMLSAVRDTQRKLRAMTGIHVPAPGRPSVPEPAADRTVSLGLSKTQRAQLDHEFAGRGREEEGPNLRIVNSEELVNSFFEDE